MFSRILTLCLFLGLTLGDSMAQSVSWNPSRGSLDYGQANQLALSFDKCEPSSEPALPPVPNLKFGAPSPNKRSYTTISNGKFSSISSYDLIYPAQPTSKDEINIPEFTVQTDKGPMIVPAAHFTVGEATVSGTGMRLSDIVESHFDPPTDEIWVGQIFRLSYLLEGDKRYLYQVGDVQWDSTPLVAENWIKLTESDNPKSGRPYHQINYTTQALAMQTGLIDLKPARQEVAIATGRDFFGNIVSNQYTQSSDPAKITVKPLPPGAPSDFTGAVGDFKLTSKVVPETANVGEPITWTLELTGKGNWPSIDHLPTRKVSRDFKAIQPNAKRTPVEGKLFEATLSEDIVLVPTQPGSYTLGPVTMSVFDPDSGTYRTITTDSTTITITGTAAPAPAPTPPPSTTASTTSPVTPASAPAALPNPPATHQPAKLIPKDPITTPLTSQAPLSSRNAWLRASFLLIIPGLLWLILAQIRTKSTDPLRRRRDAAIRLQAILDQIVQPGLSTGELRRQLAHWQHHTATLFNLNQATPTARDLPDAVWAALWQETERTIYRAGAPLSNEWALQARQALSSYRLPKRPLLGLLHPRNLFPVLALGCLALGLPSTAKADSALEAYNNADFAQAETIWRKSVDENALSPDAHYNLSLALAQQDKWTEAAAHALAAFVQCPQNANIRWQLHLCFQRAGYELPAASALLEEQPLATIARQAPLPRWQTGILLLSGLLSVGLILTLLRAYDRLPRWISIPAWCLIVSSALGFILIFMVQQAYGPLGRPDIQLVWQRTTLRSVPTESDEAQQTSALSAGTLATMDKTFLGWRHIILENGQTGWVRKSNLQALWASSE